jgi:predicted lysophospholipase L1 biosynthesis ABC-type transport system permease subunit
VLVKYFRNPVLLKVVGTTVALAFLLVLVGYRNMIRVVLPGLVVLILFVFLRRYVVGRRNKLTKVEEEYLEKRFYKH